MGLLYLDPTPGYSDPAKTGYVYMREDGQWAPPDSEHGFYDATGNVSVPELGPMHGITYRIHGTSIASFDEGNPDKAAAGSTVTVTVNCDGFSLVPVNVGWVRADTGPSEVTDPSQMNVLTSFVAGEATCEFTMPDCDVVVWIVDDPLPPDFS